MDDALARLDAELASVDPSALATTDGAILAAACARVATAALDSARRSEDALQWARAAHPELAVAVCDSAAAAAAEARAAAAAARARRRARRTRAPAARRGSGRAA